MEQLVAAGPHHRGHLSRGAQPQGSKAAQGGVCRVSVIMVLGRYLLFGYLDGRVRAKGVQSFSAESV